MKENKPIVWKDGTKFTDAHRHALAAYQQYRCACCDLEDYCLVADHDHKTGFVRGMVCTKCNAGLGMLGDDIDGLKKALKYLTNSHSKLPIKLPVLLSRSKPRGMAQLPLVGTTYSIDEWILGKVSQGPVISRILQQQTPGRYRDEKFKDVMFRMRESGLIKVYRDGKKILVSLP